MGVWWTVGIAVGLAILGSIIWGCLVEPMNDGLSDEWMLSEMEWMDKQDAENR